MQMECPPELAAGGRWRLPERRVSTMFREILIFLVFIAQGLCAYALSAVVVSDAALCAYFFSSPRFHLLILRAFNTQILGIMLVESFATLYLEKVLFPNRAMAILAGIRKRNEYSFLKVVTVIWAYATAILSAFRLLDVLAVVEQPLMLLGGGAIYLGGTVLITVVYRRLAFAVFVEGAAAMRRLIVAGMLCAVAVLLVHMAVLTAFPSQVLASGMAVNMVVVVVVMVAQAMLYHTF